MWRSLQRLRFKAVVCKSHHRAMGMVGKFPNSRNQGNQIKIEWVCPLAEASVGGFLQKTQ